MNATFAIDARYLSMPITGIERYLINLLNGIHQLGHAGQCSLIVRQGVALPEGIADAPYHLIEAQHDPRTRAGLKELKRIVLQHQFNILHCPDLFAPKLKSCKVIITVHDMIPLQCPELLVKSKKSRFRWLWLMWVSRQVKAADQIITVSEASKAAICKFFPGVQHKLDVIYNSVVLSADIDRVPSPDKKVMLYVGRRDPYKNLQVLGQTLKYLHAHSSEAVELWLAGKQDQRYQELETYIKEHDLEHAFVDHGYVDEPRLNELYQQASIFVFPSLYEGFGLPPIEAMLRGLPVVCYDLSIYRELMKDLPYYAQTKEDSFEKACFMALENEQGSIADQDRQMLADRYLPKKQAKLILELYARVLG